MTDREQIERELIEKWFEQLDKELRWLSIRYRISDDDFAGISKWWKSVGEALHSREITLRELRLALEDSVELQSHYATLLNMNDGGERRTFTAESWLARLREIGRLKKELTPTFQALANEGKR